MRNIPPGLVKLIDDKLGNGSEDPVQLMRQALIVLIGVHEEGGDNKGAIVEMFQDTVGVPMGQAWCMDFIQSAIAYVEKKLGVTCPLPATEGTQFMANWAKGEGLLSQHAAPNSLIIWAHANGSGHVGYVLSVRDGEEITTVEGNTSAENKEIVREGDTVAMKQRKTTSTHNMVVRGFVAVTFR